jgi:hypothetical protein
VNGHHDELMIRVHRAWNGWRSAEVRLSHLRDVHWRQPAGAPHPLIHAYVSCDDVVSGAIPHECHQSARVPHMLLVCVLKHHTLCTPYADLVRCANARAAGPANVRTPSSAASAP